MRSKTRPHIQVLPLNSPGLFDVTPKQARKKLAQMDSKTYLEFIRRHYPHYIMKDENDEDVTAVFNLLQDIDDANPDGWMEIKRELRRRLAALTGEAA